MIDAELSRVRSRLAGLDADERAAVEALVRGVAAKLLHDPIVGLKERVEPGTGAEVAPCCRELLGLASRRRVTTLRIATRRSELAMAQAGIVRLLSRSRASTSCSCRCRRPATRTPLGPRATAKDRWIDAIVESLRTGAADLAVHSAKDLPAEDRTIS